MVASLRLTVAQMEKHQQRDAHEAAESKKLLEKKAESLQASVAQLTAERDALRRSRRPSLPQSAFAPSAARRWLTNLMPCPPSAW